jgi:hypothetical protein
MGFASQVAAWSKDLKVIPGIQVLVCPPESVQPIFMRLPQEGKRCPITGLSLGTVRNVLADHSDKIIVRVLKRRGGRRIVKLIEVESYVAFFQNLPKASEREIAAMEEEALEEEEAAAEAEEAEEEAQSEEPAAQESPQPTTK